jgi:UDP-arabinose 4-epimerase
MRVLITGGAGFIGSHTCKALAQAGHEPVVYDNLRTGHRWAVKWGPFEYGDLHDTVRLAHVMKTHKIEAVIHFAAVAYVGESMAHPDLYWRTNLIGTYSLVEAMRMAGVGHIVFSSTCATYGSPDVMPITEATPQTPINPYGESKLAVERMLRDFAQSFGINAVALRYFNAAGSDPDGDIGEEHDPEPHIIPSILQAAAGLRPSVSIFGTDYPTGDGTCVRDYIHVADLADAHVKALKGGEAGKLSAFNLGNGKGHSIRELIAAAREVTGSQFKVETGPRRPGDPPILVADAAHARAVLGWTPVRQDMASMMATTWAWMTEHRTKVGYPRLGK